MSIFSFQFFSFRKRKKRCCDLKMLCMDIIINSRNVKVQWITKHDLNNYETVNGFLLFKHSIAMTSKDANINYFIIIKYYFGWLGGWCFKRAVQLRATYKNKPYIYSKNVRKFVKWCIKLNLLTCAVLIHIEQGK